MSPYKIRFACLLSLLLAGVVRPSALNGLTADPENLIEQMDSAYAQVRTYQTNMEIVTHRSDGSIETIRFLYSFKKPNRIRLDFESPHSGWVLVYPGDSGKVLIRPAGLFGFLKLRFDPEDSYVRDPSGQRIDQTDLGLLIENISHSLTEWRRGPLVIEESEERIRLRVLSENHFRKGIVTSYMFVVDKRLWLPVEVQESRPDGIAQRTIVFRDLKTNIRFSEGFFLLGG